MKILWLSSVSLTNDQVLASGTWIPGMFTLLQLYFPELEIVNVTKAHIRETKRIEKKGLTEWIIPFSSEMDAKLITHISTIIEEEKPDVVQVWGTEDCWGMYPFKELCPQIPSIVEIQGILSSVTEEYYGGLTPGEMMRCWNVKECIKPSSSLPAIRQLYSKNVDRERRILESFRNVGVQSKWSERVVETYNRNARFFKSGIALRQEFYDSPKWEPSRLRDLKVFSTALVGQPLKGAWTLFQAFAIIKKRFPEAQLILAGVKEEGIRRSGFHRMIYKFANDNGFANDIHHVGKATAAQLAKLYRTSSVFINPSNCESYSVVTAEAMLIGIPSVVAYSGASPELGVDGSVLYFPKGDFRICASLVVDILKDCALATELSRKSIKLAEQRQSQEGIARLQMETYLNLTLTDSEC